MSAAVSQPQTSPYPSVPQMIRTHTLADNIMTGHTTTWPVLDASELSILRRFVLNPSDRDAILEDNDVVNTPGQQPGSKAGQDKGSLACYIVATWGGERSALNEEEVEELREWFESGGGKGGV